MNRTLVVAALIGLACLAGCSEEPIPTASPEPTPLTLEEWKELPIPEKWDGSSLDRLRMSDPKLKSERAWDAYMRQHVIPERKKDIPGVPGVDPEPPSAP